MLTDQKFREKITKELRKKEAHLEKLRANAAKFKRPAIKAVIANPTSAELYLTKLEGSVSKRRDMLQDTGTPQRLEELRSRGTRM